MFGLVVATALLGAPCASGEATVFSCNVKKKVVALCAGPAAAPTYLQYRFGPPGAPELVYPPTPAGVGAFRYEEIVAVSSTGTSVTVTNGAVRYEVYAQGGARDGGAGVNVSEGGKVKAALRCDGDTVENWPIAAALLQPATATATATATSTATSTKTATAGGPRPDPLKGKSLRDICNDDTLLLLKYPFDDLHSGGFQKTCCVKAALGDDDRCQLDWPSSDVPLCSEVDLWRNALYAVYGYSFKDPALQKHFDAQPGYQPRSDFDAAWMPAVAQKNAARLKALVAAGGCVPAEALTAASDNPCGIAGVNLSLALQRGAKGQIDGMQQSEMAEAITAQCQASWPGDVAACFARGDAACRVPPALAPALSTTLRAINPDVPPL